MSDILLIAGLGNPGSNYTDTRHNAGFQVIDELAYQIPRFLNAPAGVTWKEKYSGQMAEVSGSGKKVILLKPDTYMNESGKSVGPLAGFYKIPPSQICIVHDELDHPLGVLRFKVGGGDGGHNGLRSVSKVLGTKGYMRLRVGIGRPKNAHSADNDQEVVHSRALDSWVLGKFSNSEKPLFEESKTRAAKGLELLITDGFKNAQMEMNRRV